MIIWKTVTKPWKHEHLALLIESVIAEDECNDTYGRGRMYASLKLKYPNEDIPSERTVYRVMERDGVAQPKRRKSVRKCVTDITEIPAKAGKLHDIGTENAYMAVLHKILE